MHFVNKVWLKSCAALASYPVPSFPHPTSKGKGNRTILIIFAKACSCISRLTRPFVVNKGFVLILSQSPDAQKRTDVLLKMMNEVEVLHRGTERSYCGRTRVSRTVSPGRTGSVTTIQPGLVLYQ